MENKFTPGPWKFTPSGEPAGYKAEGFLGSIENENGWSIAAIFDDCDFHKFEEQDENEANAKLIAAAPDLLKALQIALSVLKIAGVRGDSIRNAEAAIQKATI